MPPSNVCSLLIASFHDLTCIQGCKIISEAECRAAVYSLSQYSTQVQIRCFITVLQQMARADPMTALLSPAVCGSMQSQMEARLANMNLKSPGLKSNVPGSPSARTFDTTTTNCQSLAFDSLSPFLSPNSAKATRATPRRTLLNSVPNSRPPATTPIAYPHLALAARLECRRAAVHGPTSVHSVRSRSAITPPRKIFLSTLGLRAHRHRLFTGSPALRPNGSPYLD